MVFWNRNLFILASVAAQCSAGRRFTGWLNICGPFAVAAASCITSGKKVNVNGRCHKEKRSRRYVGFAVTGRRWDGLLLLVTYEL